MKTDKELRIEELLAEGWASETIGSVDEQGYYALIKVVGDPILKTGWYITLTTSQGFTYFYLQPDARTAHSKWAEVVEDYEKFYSEDVDNI